MIHCLKTWPSQFAAILDGSKRHEIRANDRNFNVGDVLVLREWTSGSDGDYTGRTVSVKVTYMTHGGEWGLPSGICVMSIGPLVGPVA